MKRYAVGLLYCNKDPVQIVCHCHCIFATASILSYWCSQQKSLTVSLWITPMTVEHVVAECTSLPWAIKKLCNLAIKVNILYHACCHYFDVFSCTAFVPSCLCPDNRIFSFFDSQTMPSSPINQLNKFTVADSLCTGALLWKSRTPKWQLLSLFLLDDIE